MHNKKTDRGRTPKLKVRRETLRALSELTPEQLGQAAGGYDRRVGTTTYRCVTD